MVRRELEKKEKRITEKGRGEGWTTGRKEIMVKRIRECGDRRRQGEREGEQYEEEEKRRERRKKVERMRGKEENKKNRKRGKKEGEQERWDRTMQMIRQKKGQRGKRWI